MVKPDFCISERAQPFAFRNFFLQLWLSRVVTQAGQCLAWSEISKTIFLAVDVFLLTSAYNSGSNDVV